ncbi:hypothetical protein SLEP1_g55358 [Rubroshorea leprosula]|uniref:Protein kinase domain-containing protein n=1 Tax=Rubroshorea leprosula TaxID=152421 RepID=A0AAV5MGC6_9ROSI|nr:hypothetical protein SLEP1_g55358 [Rubroshorea leprosula]
MESFFKVVLLFLCFLLIANVSELKAAEEKCQTKRCKHQTIRFPFGLKGLEPDLCDCGYPGFDISYIEKKRMVLELPQNVKLVVKHIDYRAQTIQLSDPGGCLPLQLPNLNLSLSPFWFTGSDPPQKYTSFNCSREDNWFFQRDKYYKIPCLSSPEFQVLTTPSDSSPTFSLVNCSRTLLNISETAVYSEMLHYKRGDIVQLSWSKPNCTKCEAVGRKCKLRNDNIHGEIECFGTTKKERERRKILLAMAKGIEYLHHGCDQQILHFDIKPHNILLDKNFNPKISDFGLAKLCSKEQSAVSMTAARGTMGYIAPEVLSRNFGKVTHKSDVYSFGMLLLEMVGGRKNADATVGSTSQLYFPEWVYNCLDRGEELRIRIENEGHAKIARKLTIVGLWCIQWYPADRPSMKAAIHMLEGEVDSLTVPPNPFGHADAVQMSANIPRKPNNRELPVIFELE